MSQVLEVTYGSDRNLAATYALIYNFLKSKSHDKAAKALKKSVQDVVVLRDDVPAPEGPSLDEIISQWKNRPATPLPSKSSPEESNSSSDSDSDSDSDEESSSKSSSSSDSSAASEASHPSKPHESPEAPLEDAEKGTAVTSKVSPERTKSKSDSDDSSSESVSDDEADSDEDDKKTEAHDVAKPKPKANRASDSDDSSSESDSSSSSEDSDVVSEKAKVADKKEKKEAVKVNAVERSGEVQITKKRKTSKNGSAVVTATTTPAAEERDIVHNGSANGHAAHGTPQAVNGVKGKPPRKSNTPFQRIKVDAVQFADERLQDNSFDAKGGSFGDYGERASRDLIVTRGAGFRKEKNKKKRGSYRGGEITMESHSIKFT